ncbi:hypothetical protein MLD38_001800 [Melastoma candidum]|uniref:Uncharacterized protein n=1 Tax=Melastoma candidum TaxID=119954 RepID=A0ACB9SG16_9MYRT|nr:hypothetical protein MLD38_001800 [Melastoma candidum]
MGMNEDFEASLQVLRGFDVDISQEVSDIKRSVASGSKRATIRIADHKQKRYWFPLAIGIGLLMLQQLSGINGVIFYSSNIFQGAGITNGNIATCGFGAVQVIATAISAGLVDKAGRRILLLISSWGMTASLFLAAASFFVEVSCLEPSVDCLSMLIRPSLPLKGMGIFFSLGIGSIPWVIMSEILPMNIKGLAGSIATLANWFVAWVVTMTANLLLNWSPGGTFSIYMIVSTFTIVFVALWVPETKGRTLEEIQRSFR